MSDLFEEKNVAPMLLHEAQPFDDEEYIYELKFDGIRCIAYIAPDRVALQNKRFKDVSELYPELANMKKCVKKKAVLDGELVVFSNGKPDFYALQKRSLTTDKFKISLAAKKNPVCFVAYDILYYDGANLTDLPLIKRKEYLKKHVKEGHGLSVSRFIGKNGTAFFRLAESEGLEGIVAKKKNGLYRIGKRTREWVKIKVMQEEDLLVCGYKTDGSGGVKDLLLGSYDESGRLRYRGKAAVGVSAEEKETVENFAKKNAVKTAWFPEYENAVWLKPVLTGTVRYMQETERGGLRQPVWKGLKTD
ncbi:MAG: hypothetical protein ACI4SH_04580 [Candidatus Scatosoma sp.]